MYTLASKFGANVYIILQFTLATTYTHTSKACQKQMQSCFAFKDRLFQPIYISNSNMLDIHSYML